MRVLSDLYLSHLLAFLAQQQECVFLDTVHPDPENSRSLLFVQPVRRLQCCLGPAADPGAVGARFLAEIEAALEAGFFVAGWFSYEFGYLLEERLAGLLSRPADSAEILAEVGVFNQPLVFDHHSGQGDFPFFAETSPFPHLPCQLRNIRPSLEREEYLQTIRTIQDYLQAGDSYQVNYTLKLLFEAHGSPEALYTLLRRSQSAPYGAYLRFGKRHIQSFSPELFLKKEKGVLTVRPMKGTLPRGRFPQEDEQQARLLRHDPKNRSENVMIVDLLRNDLGRLSCHLGDAPVRTRSLFDVERYETLWQMTSTVVAEAMTGPAGMAADRSAGGEEKKVSLTTLFRALFPCGSVTGAPKIRTMEIINELEPGRRGVYTGAIGYLAPNGNACWSVPIRTLCLHGGLGEMGIGSGIIADSDPEQEWQECLLKARFLTHPAPVFHLIETLLWEPGSGYWLRNEHLCRLASSAAFFLFSCDLTAIEQRLDEESLSFPATPMRVRLTLAKDGSLALGSQPCPAPAFRSLPRRPDSRRNNLPKVRVSRRATDTTGPWVFHKTTMRQLYDQELEEVREKGLFEGLFGNERGELTEGGMTNIILYRQGEFVTPAVSCGLLAGVMRQQLLADPTVPVREAVLFQEDLRQAEAIFLCNSVRGVVQVALEEQ